MICKERDCTRMARTIVDKTKQSIKVGYKKGGKLKFTYIYPSYPCPSGLCNDCYQVEQRQILKSQKEVKRAKKIPAHDKSWIN